MSRIFNFSMIVFLGVAMLSLVGLRLAASPSTVASPADPSSPSMAAEAAAGLLEPDKSDQELIEKQKTCPVTDAVLGSMGTPVKVQVKGRTVFLCCSGCKKTFLKNVDKYLEKIDKQSRKQ